jgi:hypothetical protein
VPGLAWAWIPAEANHELPIQVRSPSIRFYISSQRFIRLTEGLFSDVIRKGNKDVVIRVTELEGFPLLYTALVNRRAA